MTSNDGLKARIISLQGQANVGLHVRSMRGAPGASTVEAGRLSGTLRIADLQQGLVELLVTGAPAAFPNLNNRVVHIPFDEILAVDHS